MAIQSPAPSHWHLDAPRDGRPTSEGRAERLASWLIVYLAALMTSLALVGGAWAVGLAR